MFAQHLGHGQHQVRSSHSYLQLAGEAKSNELGRAKWKRLAQQRGLRFDPTDTPPEHAQPVDHRRVVGADESVGNGEPLPILLERAHDGGQVFEVDLVHDAHAGRHHAEARKGLLGPPEQRVALVIALVLTLDVDLVGASDAKAST